ncbi:MAG: Gfo/Idh/MocA family oxidoreductase, partial [Bacteroidota bacterium]
MQNSIQICIAGLGRAGRFHLHSIRNNPQFELRYIVDPGLSANDEVLRGLNVSLLDALAPALADEQLDAVVVASPTQFHYRAIVAALQAGKHVFTEKPLGKTVGQINDCYAAAEQQNRVLHLGFQRRFDRNFIALKNSLSQIGAPRIIKTSSRDNPQPSLDYLRISGNIFHDMLIHDFDMLIFLMGLKIPKTVYATGHAYDPAIAALDDFDTVMVTLHYNDGLMVVIDTSRIATYGYDQRIEVFSERGMTIADNQRNHQVQLHNESGTHLSPINYSFPSRYKEAYGHEMTAFAKAITTAEKFSISREECLLAHLIADAAHESATSGKPINFAEA